MSVWELYTQLFERNWRCGWFARSLSQGCSEKIGKKDVVMTEGRWSSWSLDQLVTDYLTKMGIKIVPQPPYSPDPGPCDFWLFPKLSLWDNWGDERGCDEGHWHTHTRGLPCGLPEVLERYNNCIAAGGDYFEECTINKSAYMKKVWKLI